MSRKIILNIGVTLEAGVINDPKSDSYLTGDIYWRLGVGRVAGKELSIERKKALDGYEYRIGTQLMNPSDIECWNASEFMEWRDS